MKRGLIEWNKNELSEAEFSLRMEKTRHLIREKGLDVIAIYGDASKSANLSYLTNIFPYSDTGIFVLTAGGSSKLFTTHAYRNLPWFNSTSWLRDIVCTNNMEIDFADYVHSLELKQGRIGLINTSSFPYPIFSRLRLRSGAEIIDLSEEFEAIRMIKSESELKFTTEASKIAIKTFNRLNEVFRPGMTGYDLAAEVELSARESAAQDVFFFLQTDNRPSGLTQPDSQPIEMICGVEMCIEYMGYWAKIGRTFFCNNLSKDFKDRNEALLQLSKKAFAELHEGQTFRECFLNTQSRLNKLRGVKEANIYLNPGLDPYWSNLLHDDRVIRKNMVVYAKIDLRFSDDLALTVTDTYTTQHPEPVLMTAF